MAKAIYGKYQCVENSYLEWYFEYEYSRTQSLESFESKVVLWEYITIDPQSGEFYCYGRSCWKEFFFDGSNGFDPVWEDKTVRKISHTNPNPHGAGGYATDQVSYVRRQKPVVTYSKGSFITNVIVDYGALPADGRHSDGYWYAFVKMASDLKGNVDKIWRDMPTGWINDNGMWKPQSELKANVNGIFR